MGPARGSAESEVYSRETGRFPPALSDVVAPLFHLLKADRSNARKVSSTVVNWPGANRSNDGGLSYAMEAVMILSFRYGQDVMNQEGR